MAVACYFVMVDRRGRSKKRGQRAKSLPDLWRVFPQSSLGRRGISNREMELLNCTTDVIDFLGNYRAIKRSRSNAVQTWLLEISSTDRAHDVITQL